MFKSIALWGMVLGSLFLVGCTSSQKQESMPAASSSLKIESAWARPAGEGARASAIYLTIHNMGADDALVSAQGDMAEAIELHNVEMKDGMMSMFPVSEIPVPAGGKAELKKGSYHIMLIRPTRQFMAGDQLEVKLNFKSGASQSLSVPVRQDDSMPSQMPMQQGGMKPMGH